MDAIQAPICKQIVIYDTITRIIYTARVLLLLRYTNGAGEESNLFFFLFSRRRDGI